MFGECRACAALTAEIGRASEREKTLLTQIADLTNKLSAHADLKAHQAATNKPVPRPEQQPREPRLPQGMVQSHGQGHVDLRKVRDLMKARGKPPRADLEKAFGAVVGE